MITWGYEYVKKLRCYEPYQPSSTKKLDESVPIAAIMAAKAKAKAKLAPKAKVCSICHQKMSLSGQCSCDPVEKFEALCALQNRLMKK